MKVIIFLATAWGMSNGGINTFNYQLCKAFAKEKKKKVRVVCVSYNISANERGNMKEQVNLDLVCMSTEKDFMEHIEEIVD